VLSAYFDASRTEVSVGIMSVAGYVAPLEEWERVEAEWQEALNYWGLDIFHLSQIEDQFGREKGALCVNYFANIIKNSSLLGIGAAVLEMDWPKAVADAAKYGRTLSLDTYAQSLASAFSVLSKAVSETWPDQGVSVVCDLDRSEDTILGIYREAANMYPSFKGFATGSCRDHIPLQVADLGVGIYRKGWLANYASNWEQGLPRMPAKVPARMTYLGWLNQKDSGKIGGDANIRLIGKNLLKKKFGFV
jgi:hypothetical protein